MECGRPSDAHYRAKVIVTVTESGVVALAETLTLKVKALVVPAATDAADGNDTVTSVDVNTMLGVTVSASWPEFATVMTTAPKSPAKTLPLHVALSKSVDVVHVTASRAKSPLTVAALMESGSLRVRVVVTVRALKA
jgi:hypothetical protein